MKKERINITMSPEMLHVADILAKKRGMNRSEYINYLLNKDADSTLSSLLADEAVADMRKTFNDFYKDNALEAYEASYEY